MPDPRPHPDCPEFDCCECGRHIIVLCGTLPDPRLCVACLCIPGWYSLREVAAVIDPERHRTVSDGEPPRSHPAAGRGA